MDAIFKFALITLAIILMHKFADSSRKKPIKEGLIAYGTGLKVLSLVLSAFWLALGYVFWNYGGYEQYLNDPDRGVWIILFVFYFIILLAVIWLCLEFFLVRIEYDPDHITTRSFCRPRRRIPWESIIGYRFGSISLWHIFHTRNKGRIRIHLWMKGIPAFMDAVEKNKGETWGAGREFVNS